MKNGKRIVLEASEGITFRVEKGTDEIVIKAIKEDSKTPNSFYSYRKPKVPEGYRHVYGDEWNEGFIIENTEDGSEFEWIPALWLDGDATLDGKNFNEKFGRVNWYNSDFSKSGYHEEVNQEFFESVKKYGGFYFARYHASKENGRLVFKKGNMPWGNITFFDAEALAANYGRCSKDVKSCITSGVAFDCVLRWIIKSRAKTLEAVVKDSTSWGNYRNAIVLQHKVMRTGSNEYWCAMGIYDLAGNVEEWTLEYTSNSNRPCARRGGRYLNDGADFPASSLDYSNTTDASGFNGFRVALF